MTTMDDVLDVSAWQVPSFTVTRHGQLAWSDDTDEALADVEHRRGPHGTLTLRQVWNADRTILRRLVVEIDWHTGPLVFAEARRPRTGWTTDALARLTNTALTLHHLP